MVWFVWCLSDFRTLRAALASSRPESPAETKSIPGIGVVKLHAVVPKFPDAISKREKNEDFQGKNTDEPQ